ncbi:Hypothetical Protein FCC1311_028222 [Hondaea fermentalgiana]|uniref:Uncharacterized protein n=1 Tax=Hondaea fermentalgiana TaxID=2315210 RepID=A0A2R5GEF9_9STRA|nr:Hypothetical Protein FCC1311_028222 [Hondaea fermentalgiana]|eukprot:GBG26601.1 Hypothetical Protein FCC1311_028222 [Hondaea fermentalgiana]
MFAAKARLKRISAKRRSIKTRDEEANAPSQHSGLIEEIAVDDAEELEYEQGKHEPRKSVQRDRAPSVGSVASGGSTDGVWNGKLSMMRRIYSWDEIPMEFFVDKFVDDASSREDSKKSGKPRARLSIAKQARPKSMRKRFSVSRSSRLPKACPPNDEDEDEEDSAESSEKQD